MSNTKSRPDGTVQARPVPVIHEGDELNGDDMTPARPTRPTKRSINQSINDSTDQSMDQSTFDPYTTPRIEKQSARTFRTAAEAGSAIQDDLDQLIDQARQIIEQWKSKSHVDMAIIQAEAAELYEARNATALDISSAIQTIIQSIDEKLESHRVESREVSDKVIKLVEDVQKTFMNYHTINQSSKTQIQHIFSQHRLFKRQKAHLQIADQAIKQIQSIVRSLIDRVTSTNERQWSHAVDQVLSCNHALSTLLTEHPSLEESKFIQTIQSSINQKSKQLTKQLNLALHSVLVVQINNKSVNQSDDISLTDKSSISIRFDANSFRDICEAFELMEIQQATNQLSSLPSDQSSQSTNRLSMSNPYEFVVTSLLDMLIRPLFRFATLKGIAYKVTVNNQSDKHTKLSLDVQLANGNADWFDAVLSITQFVTSCQAINTQSDNHILSQFLTGLMPLLVDQLATVAIPVDVDQLMNFRAEGDKLIRLENELRKVEQSMNHLASDSTAMNSSNHNLQICSPKPIVRSQLSDFVHSIPSHFTQSYRLAILDQCRDLLLDNQYETIDPLSFKSSTQPRSISESIKLSDPSTLASVLHQSATQAFFDQSNCAVSNSMHNFALILWQCAIQAVKAFGIDKSQLFDDSDHHSDNQSTNQTSESLVFDISQYIIQTINQSIYLVLSIPSVYSVDQLSSVPVIAAIFCNDNQFISFHCLKIQSFLIGYLMDCERDCKLVEHIIGSTNDHALISPSVKQITPKLRASIRLIDFVAPLRELGLQWFRHLVTNINQSIKQTLDGLPSFDDIDQPRTYQSVKQIINQCSHLIGLSNKQLRPVVESKALQRLMDCSIDCIINRIVDLSCNVANLSMEGSKNLELILGLIDNLADSMHSKPQHNQAPMQSNNQPVFPNLSVQRLRALAQFIRQDATLAKLSVEVKQNDYRVLSMDQLINLTRAIYEDSFKRQSFLGLLEAHMGDDS